ncbi:MAG: UTP--glucose-1-phosphate uridylyltransferase [Acidobacteria bacterium RIFCSPHIGHO2_12_FULL_67_30]|nr:MAG: UTP--glucose-1-phosphate uridylyltransferase [Acidobacteria bacterium RIFCSPHIGHO2_12_FULL_67_30]
MKRLVRKAVIPVAGLGTRFLPATKAMPKEMLTLVDKPLIQYTVEEAVASGIEEIILITGEGTEPIVQHFARKPALERELRRRGKAAEARLVERLGRLARVRTVRQAEPLGLGHAVGCARRLVGREPFAVLLPDDLIDAAVPCTKQLLEVHAACGGSVIATQRVEGPSIENYGVMAVAPAAATRAKWRNRLFRVRDLVEKPKLARAPSPWIVVGRYILEPEVFDFIAGTRPGRGGEIQLTDALRRAARERAVHALAFGGVRHDAGDKLGFLRATLYYARKHPELGPAFRDALRSLKL